MSILSICNLKTTRRKKEEENQLEQTTKNDLPSKHPTVFKYILTIIELF